MVDGRIMEVHEMVEDANFAGMCGSLNNDLEKLWMPVALREAFCEEHRDKLRKDGYATFFLHKVDEAYPATPDNLLVASVGARSGGLCVCEYRFGYDRLWSAEDQLRLVSPQLERR